MTETFDLSAVARRFIDDVFAKAEESVDPCQERDWEDLAFGYLLALGADPTDPSVHRAATYMACGRPPPDESHRHPMYGSL